MVFLKCYFVDDFSNNNLVLVTGLNEAVVQESSGKILEFHQTENTYKIIFDVTDESLYELVLRREKKRGKIDLRWRAKEGWKYNIFTFLSKNISLECKWLTKRNLVIDDGKVFCTDGYCKCGGKIEVFGYDNKLEFVITGIDKKYRHTERYHIVGTARQELNEKLKSQSALKTRQEIIGEYIPGNTSIEQKRFIPGLPTLNTLNKIKYTANKIKEDPIDVLIDWAGSSKRDVILHIGAYPFYVFYRSVLQYEWFKAECKHKRVSIAIDATGSVIKPPARSQKIAGTNKYKHIFLYSILMKTTTSSVAIAQMVTQKHSHEFIAYFFKCMFRDIKKPAEIVVDESKAIILALIVSFTSCRNLNEYVHICMTCLNNDTSPPKCYIRLDRSHFVKTVTRNINDNDARRRLFYRSVIGYLIQCDSFQVARSIISDFFIVINNRYDGFNKSGLKLQTEKSKERLIKLCSTHVLDDTDNGSANLKQEVDHEAEKLCEVTVSPWLTSIIQSSYKNEKSIHENLYYSPDDVKYYSLLFSKICLWSNVMNSKFKSTTTVATSSDVESSFKNLKYYIFDNKKHRADLFIEKHLKFVDSEIKQRSIKTNSNSFIRYIYFRHRFYCAFIKQCQDSPNNWLNWLHLMYTYIKKLQK